MCVYKNNKSKQWLKDKAYKNAEFRCRLCPGSWTLKHVYSKEFPFYEAPKMTLALNF